MLGLIIAAILFLISVFALLLIARNYRRPQFALLLAALFLHVLAAIAQVIVTRDYYGGGDMEEYWFYGALNAESLRRDFVAFFPDLIRFFFGLETTLPIAALTTGATGSMCVVSSMLMYLLDDSLWAACIVISMCSFFSKLAIFRVLRASFPASDQTKLLAGIMLLPTLIFWSSGLLKESIVMIALGPLSYGAFCLSRARWTVGLALIAISAPPIAMLKPYVLLPFSIGVGLWYASARTRTTQTPLKPMYLVLGATVAVLGVLGVGYLFPNLAVEQFGTTAASSRMASYSIAAGSNISYGEDVRENSGGASTTVLFAPLALATALFRPTLIESKNVMMFTSALENTLLLWLFLRALFRNGFWRLFESIRGSPGIAFCTTFTLIFATAVGLSAMNLGSLSRYRVVTIPFFLAVLVYSNSREVFARKKKVVIAPRNTAARVVA